MRGNAYGGYEKPSDKPRYIWYGGVYSEGAGDSDAAEREEYLKGAQGSNDMN